LDAVGSAQSVESLPFTARQRSFDNPFSAGEFLVAPQLALPFANDGFAKEGDSKSSLHSICGQTIEGPAERSAGLAHELKITRFVSRKMAGETSDSLRCHGIWWQRKSPTD